MSDTQSSLVPLASAICSNTTTGFHGSSTRSYVGLEFACREAALHLACLRGRTGPDAQRQKRAVAEYLADLRRRLGYRRVAMALNGNNTNSLAQCLKFELRRAIAPAVSIRLEPTPHA